MTSTLQTELDPRTVDFTYRPRQMFVDGEWVNAFGQAVRDSRPGHRAGRHHGPGGPEDVDLAVRAARRAFQSGPWPALAPTSRTAADDLARRRGHHCPRRRLRAAGDHRQRQVGRGGQGRRRDVGRGDLLYCSRWATEIEGRTVPVLVPWAPGARFHTFTLREPVGVCAQIVPWNFPLVMAAFKVARAWPAATPSSSSPPSRPR